ncbi:MAG: HAD-IA family hydrolase [Candidatus Binataceae bacterium]
MLRAVFFDAAGTLFDAREPVGSTYARIARSHGLHARDEVVAASFRRAFGAAPPLAFGVGRAPADLRRLERQWWRERVAETFAGLGEVRDFDAYFDELFTYFASPASWLADPEAARLLQRLKSSGLTVGVISNFDHRLYRILDGLGLGQWFDSITISSEAGYAKPAPEVFDAALARHRLTPGEVVHVGDSQEHDFRAAARVGMAAILFDRRAPAAEMSRDRAARVCSLASVHEVAQVLALA